MAAYYAVQQRCSQTAYFHEIDHSNNPTMGPVSVPSLEDCVARCVSSGSSCAVMAFKFSGECWLYETGPTKHPNGNLTDFFSTHEKRAEVLFVPEGCSLETLDCPQINANNGRQAELLCPDPAVDEDCYSDGVPLYAQDICTIERRPHEI